MSKDFIETAEYVNIWVFLGFVLVAVACMFPEALMESSELYSWLSVQANVALIALCVMWLLTQSLWFFARKYLEKFGNWETAVH